MEGNTKPTFTETIKAIPSIISTLLAIGSIIFTMALFFTKVEAHDKQIQVQAQETSEIKQQMSEEVKKANELHTAILTKLAVIETKLNTDGENIREIKEDIKDLKKQIENK